MTNPRSGRSDEAPAGGDVSSWQRCIPIGLPQERDVFRDRAAPLAAWPAVRHGCLIQSASTDFGREDLSGVHQSGSNAAYRLQTDRARLAGKRNPAAKVATPVLRLRATDKTTFVGTCVFD